MVDTVRVMVDTVRVRDRVNTVRVRIRVDTVRVRWFTDARKMASTASLLSPFFRTPVSHASLP